MSSTQQLVNTQSINNREYEIGTPNGQQTIAQYTVFLNRTEHLIVSAINSRCWLAPLAANNSLVGRYYRLAPVSNVIFSKTDNLSKIAIYKLYLEVEVLGLDIRITKFDYQRGYNF